MSKLVFVLSLNAPGHKLTNIVKTYAGVELITCVIYHFYIIFRYVLFMYIIVDICHFCSNGTVFSSTMPFVASSDGEPQPKRSRLSGPDADNDSDVSESNLSQNPGFTSDDVRISLTFLILIYCLFSYFHTFKHALCNSSQKSS